jgi:signal transduction histidine kinase
VKWRPSPGFDLAHQFIERVGSRPVASSKVRDRVVDVLLQLRRIRSPLLMLATITFLEALSKTAFAVPDSSRALVYVLIVAIAAANDGLRPALVSALFAVAFDAYRPYLVASQPDGRALFVLVFASIGTATVIASLFERVDRLRFELDTEKNRLTETIRTRSEFMNAAAHELRTPITVVTGYISMLHEGNFGPAPQRWLGVLEIIMGKAHELSSLVEQMLLSARLESGTVPAARMPLDLRDVVREAAERANPRATLLEASIAYQLPSSSVMVEADPDHVACILDNLINNSLTYSDGHPWVRLTVMEEGDAQVLVEDHGRGVRDEMRERIFERFVRVSDPDRSPVPGTGLGLAISRDLAKQQGGNLALVRSEVGSGSLFVLRLPCLQRGQTAWGKPQPAMTRQAN